jgi:hypothetical protein
MKRPYHCRRLLSADNVAAAADDSSQIATSLELPFFVSTTRLKKTAQTTQLYCLAVHLPSTNITTTTTEEKNPG